MSAVSTNGKAKVLLALAQNYAFCWWIENQSTSHNSMLVEKLVLARKFTNWVRRKRKKQQNIHICLFLSVIKQCLSWSLTSITQLTSQWSRNETDEKHGSELCRIDLNWFLRKTSFMYSTGDFLIFCRTCHYYNNERVHLHLINKKIS